MNEQELVPRKEVCEKLREAGYPQGESYFVWTRLTDKDEFYLWEDNLNEEEEIIVGEKISAPTFQEIWERLPKCLNVIENGQEDKTFLSFYNDGISYEFKNQKGFMIGFFENNQLLNLTKLYIWLSENGYLEEE